MKKFLILLSLLSSPALRGEEVPPGEYLGLQAGTVIIADGVTAIGEGAFAGSGITHVVIPEGVETIGDYAFHGCAGLSEVILPTTLRKIGKGAFTGCTALLAVDIPDRLERIGDEAFRGCGLRSFEPGSGSALRSMGRMAFAGCDRLETVCMPDGVSSVGDAALFGCRRLRTVALPSGLSGIPRLMLADALSVESLSLPEALSSVGDAAMDGCAGLVYIDATELSAAPAVGEDTWHGVETSGVDLFVTRDAAPSFLADARWCRFKIRTDDATSVPSVQCGLPATFSFDGDVVTVKSNEKIKSLLIYTTDGKLVSNIAADAPEVMVRIPASARAVVISVRLESGASITRKLLTDGKKQA